MSFLTSLKSMFAGSQRADVQARFELLKEAISGTMSKFYMARDRNNDRIVGLKILDAEKTKQLEDRFKGLNKPSEGEISMKLQHPRIVHTYEHGVTTRNEPYIVMEYLDGPGLNSLLMLKNPKLDGNRVALIRHAAQALVEVHRAGFIHRDMCPRNLVVNRANTELKLIDFGLTVPDTPPFRRPGVRTGTPSYMAPEVVRRRPTSKQIDVFSFGVTAYQICTMEHPWPKGASGLDAMKRGLSDPQDIRILRPQINESLARAIHQCIEPEPTRRLESISSFLEMIDGVEHEDGN